MAFNDKTKATVQTIFNTSIKAFMAEAVAGNIKKLCNIKTQTGGDKAIFYYGDEATAEKSTDGTIPSMEVASNTTDNKGTNRKVEVEIGQIYYQSKIDEVEIKRTGVDLKSFAVVSMGNALLRKEDAEVIGAIKDAIANFTPVTGDATTQKPLVKDLTANGKISADKNIKTLVAYIRRATAYSALTVAPESYKGVAVVMHADDWAEMAVSELMINGDYQNAVEQGDGTKPSKFFGAEIICVTNVPVGEMYVIPSGCISFAEWEGSVRGFAEFKEFSGMKWFLQGIKSVGAKVHEGKRITQIKVAPADLG